MSQGVAVSLMPGRKNPENLYIKLRNGAIYRYQDPVPVQHHQAFTAKLDGRGRKAQLKFWVKVR